jgi:hypothetical protein
MTKKECKRNLETSVLELKSRFSLFAIRQKYNDFWINKVMDWFDTMLEYVSIITRKRTILIVRALNNLESCEPIFYKENAECIEILKKEVENFYKNFYCSELDRRNLRRKKNFLFNNGFHLIGDGVYYQKTNKIRIELSLYNTYTYEEERYDVL